MPVRKTLTLWEDFRDREGKEAAVLLKRGETVGAAVQHSPGDDQFKGRGRGGLLFPKEQLVTSVVTSAVKLTLVPVKIIYAGSRTTIWSAAVTATIYGRSS